MRLLPILIPLLTALLTTATATVPTATAAAALTAATAATTDIQWRTCPGGIRAADAGLMPTARSPAAQGQRCGQIRVPLDHGKVNGPAITIAVSRLTMADPAVRRGVLLIVPGGPGGAGLDLPGQVAMLMPPEVLARYDLVSFDPRFVGRSTPVTCGIPESRLIDIEPWPRPGLSASMDRIAAGCDARLAHTSSADIARDMDLVRRALGEKRVSLLGYSAGAFLSAVYQSLFPDRVDRALLDSGADPDLVWRGVFRAWGAATEARFPDFAAYVTRTGLVANPAEARALYFALAARLDTRPVTLTDGNALTGSVFREATRQALYSDQSFPGLAALWSALRDGRVPGVTLAQVVPIFAGKSAPAEPGWPAVPPDSFVVGFLGVVCRDAVWPRSTHRYTADVAVDSLRYPLVGSMSAGMFPCARWRFPTAPPVTLRPATRDTLVLHNLRDPAAPLSGGRALASALGPKARFLSFDQGGHGTYLLSANPEANAIGTAYLAHGLLPG